jgi:hypothetical protein
MPIHYTETEARIEEQCTVEEAEPLFEWLQEHPEGRVDLSACDHMHTAILQVLMALRPPVSAPPDEPFFARWLFDPDHGTTVFSNALVAPVSSVPQTGKASPPVANPGTEALLEDDWMDEPPPPEDTDADKQVERLEGLLNSIQRANQKTSP